MSSEGIKGKQILVVDDDLELCQVIVDTLTDQGYRAVFVQSTEEALKKIETKPPDLILLDLEVPSSGGFVLCQKIHENPATNAIPIIFLTVRDSDFDRKTAMSLGADLYITKPFRRSHLLKSVEGLLTAQAERDDVISPSASHARTEIGTQPASPQPSTSPAKPDDFALKQRLAAQLKTVQDELKPALRKTWSWGLANRKVSIPIVVLVLAALVAGSVGFFRMIVARGGLKVPGELGGEISVNVIQAALAPFQDVLSNVGTIKGGAEIELRFQTEGNIRAINFHDGDSVHSGQVIAQLDQSQAQIKLSRARQEYFRYEKLYALGGVSKDRLEEAKGQLDYAQSDLNKTILRASQDGIFGGKDAAVGEYVTPQKKIGTLASLNPILVNFGVIEKEIDKIAVDQKVIVTVETYPNVEFKGKVINISPFNEGQARTFTVEAMIPNDGRLLLPGMFARTKIIVYEKEGVIAIPNDAVEKTANGYQVFVVGPENKCEARPVEVVYVSLVNSVISTGLSPGDKVIIQRPQELKEGAAVKIIDVEKPITESSAMDALGGSEKQAEEKKDPE